MEREEVNHLIGVLEGVKRAIVKKEAVKLKAFSDQTIHDSSIYQDAASITLAVVVYAMSKIIERQDYSKFENWESFVEKLCLFLDRAINSLREGQFNYYQTSLKNARKELESVSGDLKPYIQEVLRKASINKGSRIYSHGISLGQVTRLLGITHWDLLEYIGQKKLGNISPDEKKVKERVDMAVEFFSK